MNRKQRRILESQEKPAATVQWRGGSYSVDDAGDLAIKEYTLGHFQSAIDIYQLILAEMPDCAEAYSNRGAALHALGRRDEALASYNKAIALKPGYADAYNNRCNALREMGRHAEALASCDKAIALNPAYANAYNNRGLILKDMKRYDEALASYGKAIGLQPACPEFYYNQAATLQDMKRHDQALASYGKAIAARPGYADAYNNRGAILMGMQRYDEALADCDKVIALQPDYAEAYNNRGMICLSKGALREAEEMFVKALELKPDFPKALYNLTHIRKYKDANHSDIQRLQSLLQNPNAHDWDYLYFSLGKIYDECGFYDEAFECYRQGNQLLNEAASYSPDGISGLNHAIVNVFSKEFLAQPRAFSSASQTPVFVVGMPRSGTTLMASILSNHPAVGTAGELPTIIDFAARMAEWGGVPYPQGAKHITAALASRMIHDYEARLKRDAKPAVSHIIDKHPLNFRHLGFIAMLFPKARIIHCTRHPLDTCLSNYFQRFSLEYSYAFDLQQTVHFYNEYAALMEHWRQALPMKMLEVSYEDMITDTESAARRMLEFLELEWDERCLAPHTNSYAVETASKWQVRQPIYKRSIGRWRHYEKRLAPLMEMLNLSKNN